MGTSLSTSCGWDGSYVSLQCLTPHLDASLDLAVDVLRNPTFPESEWERVHGQTLAALRAERDSAEARAYRGLLRALYGPDHPYRLPDRRRRGRPSPPLTRDDLRAVPPTATTARARPPASWPATSTPTTSPRRSTTGSPAGPARRRAGPEVRPPRASSDRPRILLLDRPGAPQAVVRVGHVGIARLDPDFTDVLVLNQILGGQFTSRLNAKLREEKGFTYGVRSHFDFRRGAGPFSISASLQTDRLAEALDDLRDEVGALLGDRPPTAAELDDARRSLIEGQARHFETPAALVSRYASLFVHGLPADYLAEFAERLDAVSVDSLRAVAARHIHPDSLVAVVVADAALVAEPLKRLEWAESSVVVE